MPDATWKVVDETMPQTGRVVKYRTARYQMLGYLDVTGHWVATDGQEETLPVRAWREIVVPVNWPERAA